MAKALVTADLHIHAHRNDSRRIEDGLECLKWIYKTAHIAECDVVIFAGDFLHNRFSINAYALSKACNIIADANIKTIFLLGNHDMQYEDRWCTHSLTALQPWANVEVIDSPRPAMDICGYPVDFLPYTPRPSLHFDIFKNPSPILISHLAVADAVLNARFNILSVEDDSKEKELLKIEDFNRWKKVFLGHYHYGQKLSPTVEYIGSPMQLTFGEANQTKHVAILNLKTLETKYIVNDVSPQFHIVDDPKELNSLKIDNAYVQIQSSGTMGSMFDWRNKLMKSGAREIEFIPTTTDIAKQTTKALDNIAQLFNDKQKLIEGFVDASNLEQNLDKNLLKKIGLKIIS